MKNIRHIFFDLDNTLWDHRKNAKLTLEKLFEKYQIQEKFQIKFEDFHTKYDKINEHLWELIRDEKIDKEYLRKHRFYDTFLHFDVDNFELAQIFEHQFLDEIIAYNEFQQAYDFFNEKLFYNELPDILITFQRGQKYLGYFSNIDDAHNAYILAKKKNIINVANEYKDKISKNVYDALIKKSNTLI